MSNRASKGVVHPKPSATVIKQLYGTAFRCGKPECRRPLYRLDDETGVTVLNSEVAHIHARSQGGPRWLDGMSSEDNRAPENLIPLCFEHAWEIDQSEDLYPAELLHEWKAAQLAECEDLRKAWPLTDAEAVEVQNKSFDEHTVGHAAASATAVMQTVSAVGAFIEHAKRVRRTPAAVAAEWQAQEAAANLHSFIYNPDTGERVMVELSRAEQRQLTERMVGALQSAVAEIEPSASTIKGSALALSVDPQLAPWCDWLSSAVDFTLEASGRWPGGGEDNDQLLSETLDALRRAAVALGQRARGLEAELPPTPSDSPSAEPPESDAGRMFREHEEVLESARRWARVDHLDFDPHMYQQLVTAAGYAVGMPDTWGVQGVGLDSTAYLAARVARNADAATAAQLIEQARELIPLAVASAFLRNIGSVAKSDDRSDIATNAIRTLTLLLQDATWATQEDWQLNKFHCRHLLALTAHLLSDDHVQARLTEALEVTPTLLPDILVGLAQWGESRDFDDFNTVLGITCAIKEIPPWIPTDALVRRIRAEMPNVTADQDNSTSPDPRQLAANILHLL